MCAGRCMQGPEVGLQGQRGPKHTVYQPGAFIQACCCLGLSLNDEVKKRSVHIKSSALGQKTREAHPGTTPPCTQPHRLEGMHVPTPASISARAQLALIWLIFRQCLAAFCFHTVLICKTCNIKNRGEKKHNTINQRILACFVTH